MCLSHGQHYTGVGYKMKRITVCYQGQHTDISRRVKSTALQEVVLTCNSSHQELKLWQNGQAHFRPKRSSGLRQGKSKKQQTQPLPVYFGRLKSS